MVKVDVITKRMRRLGIKSGEQLAERAKISRQTVWNLLNEKHTPETKTLIAVASALDVPLSSIIDEKAAA